MRAEAPCVSESLSTHRCPPARSAQPGGPRACVRLRGLIRTMLHSPRSGLHEALWQAHSTDLGGGQCQRPSAVNCLIVNSASAFRGRKQSKITMSETS